MTSRPSSADNPPPERNIELACLDACVLEGAALITAAQAVVDTAALVGIAAAWDKFTTWVGNVYDGLTYAKPPVIPDGWDGTTPPADGWEWRGKGPQGGPKGAWVSPDGKESLHPDFQHGPPIGPHVDWNSPGAKGKDGMRIFPDGRVEPKR